VLVEGDRIAAVGELEDRLDAHELDAAGAIVAPGFVDVHTHADFTLLAFPTADSAVRQGVTTVVTGNCGGGVAPAEPAHDVRRVAFGYDDAWGVDLDWRTFAEYLERLDGTGVNVAALVPHGAVRNAVMGLESRSPSARELAAMRAIVDDAMAAGAAGLSTGLEYQPGCFADDVEIAQLCEGVARRGGLYATHMRNRAERFSDAVREALGVAARSGVRLQLSHVAPRPYAPPDEVERAFEAIDGRASVWVDTFPEIWGPGTLADLLPRAVVQGAALEVARRLEDPDARRAVAEAFARGDNFLVRAGGYERIFVSANPCRPEQTGHSVAALAEEAGKTIADWACDTLVEAGPLLMSVAIRHVYAVEDDLRRVIALPCCSFGSDGVVTAGEGPGCPFTWNASSYGYAARVLEHYVRDESLLTLEDAVRKLAALPADALGLPDRGRVVAGAAADVVVLDLDGLADRTTPVDMARHPSGIRTVLVNGVELVRDGAPTGARPGRVLSPS
jgi:N-acyl-D-amino-acid deacylase